MLHSLLKWFLKSKHVWPALNQEATAIEIHQGDIGNKWSNISRVRWNVGNVSWLCVLLLNVLWSPSQKNKVEVEETSTGIEKIWKLWPHFCVVAGNAFFFFWGGVVQVWCIYLLFLLVPAKMFCEVRITKPVQAPQKNNFQELWHHFWVVAGFFFLVPVRLWCIWWFCCFCCLPMLCDVKVTKPTHAPKKKWKWRKHRQAPPKKTQELWPHIWVVAVFSCLPMFLHMSFQDHDETMLFPGNLKKMQPAEFSGLRNLGKTFQKYCQEMKYMPYLKEPQLV